MKVRAAIRNMTPYSPPLEGRDPSVNTLLDFNESVLPPGSDILLAMHRFIDSGRLQVYPEYQRLEQKLSAFHGIQTGQLLLTNGSDQGIDVVLRALLGAGDALLAGLLRDPRETALHAGVCAGGQWTWLQ